MAGCDETIVGDVAVVFEDAGFAMEAEEVSPVPPELVAEFDPVAAVDVEDEGSFEEGIEEDSIVPDALRGMRDVPVVIKLGVGAALVSSMR